jgi:LuxR family maltose regulon positive regulatory protein
LNLGLQQNCQLTLVCAPAGYGKTTLVRDWLQTIQGTMVEDASTSVHCAWVALDREDDDLVNFLQYLIAALQTVYPGAGESLRVRLKTSRLPSGQELAILLINDLAGISGRVLLVLDDYHLISGQPIHDFISFLIEHKPPGFALVIATRADPPLPLARLRARGQLVEIRQEELQFSNEEMVQFLDRELGVALHPIQYQTLGTRMEGWIAGLQLAALSMRNLKDPASFIEALSGRQEYIAEYLAGEVIAQQPEAVVTFLLQTSILERLSEPLCNAVTGQTHSQETLDYLMEANLFLFPLDQQREWFRYHRLFADLLRKRLDTFNSELAVGLHRKASRWYQENGFLSQAIEHALLGQDFEQAASLIKFLAEDGLAYGQTGTLLRWLETLPADVKDHHLSLWVYQGLAMILCGQKDTPVRLAVERFSESAAEESCQGEISVLEALRAVMDGNGGKAISQSKIAMQQLPPDRWFFRCLAADSLGMAYTLQGDTAAAIQAFEQVVALSTQGGIDMMAILALSSLAGLHTMQGHLRTSASLYQRVMELAEERFGKHSPYTGKALLGLGELDREWNDLESAQGHFLESVEALRQFSEIGLTISYLSLARVKFSQRDWEGVQDYLSKARLSARESRSTQMDDYLTDLMQARYWVAHGDLDPALHWARSRGYLDLPMEKIIGQERNKPVNEFLYGQYGVLARLYLALERPAEALKVIEPLLANSLKFGHLRRGIEFLILKAIALGQQRNPERAVEAIGEALRLGEAEGFQRVFLDEGKPVVQLLYRAVDLGICPAYAGNILSGFSHSELVPSAMEVKGHPHEDLVEALSDREKEVLSLVVEGLSNREIAGRLFISLSTVKGHIAHIFGKLGAKNRAQAISRARDFGLISDR